MLSMYRAVMDSNHNPLRHLPPAQRFQTMMFLSMMWTAIFCSMGGLWFLVRRTDHRSPSGGAWFRHHRHYIPPGQQHARGHLS